MKRFNSTRRPKRSNNSTRKASKNSNKEDPTILFDRWHMDPVPLKTELTAEQKEFVKQLLEKKAYEQSPEGQAAMQRAYFQKAKMIRRRI